MVTVRMKLKRVDGELATRTREITKLTYDSLLSRVGIMNDSGYMLIGIEILD